MRGGWLPDEAKFQLADAPNTWNPALLILKAKGYEVRPEVDDKDQIYRYWATRDGYVFVGASPLAVLGLVAIWENRGESWGTRDGEPNLLYDLEVFTFASDDEPPCSEDAK